METREQTKEEQLKEIGRCAYASIVEMVAALQCDYERLQELKELKADGRSCPECDYEGPCDACPQCVVPTEGMDDDERKELVELEEAGGECESREDAEQRIQEDPLSLQLRSGWYSPGETPEPEEFELLLSTGGPAVRIIGELGEHNEPDCARLQAQDWFTPWTDYIDASQETLLAYCRVFYFGD